MDNWWVQFRSITFLFCLIAMSGGARAAETSLTSSTSKGSNTLSEDLNGSGTFGPEEIWSWNLDYTFTRSSDPSTTTTSGTALVETTRDYRAGMGWEDEGGFISGTGEYAVTPAEGLTNTGLQLVLSRKFKYGERAEGEFRPWFSTGLTLGGNSYRQVFTGVVKVTKKAAKPVTGENLLDQKSVRLDFKWRPIELIALKLGGTTFGYNRSVADFESFLDSSMAANRGMSGLSGTVGGLPASQISLGAKIYFGETWDLNAEYSRSVLAADRSLSLVARLQLDWDPIEALHFSGGTERDASDGTVEWLTLFTAGVTF